MDKTISDEEGLRRIIPQKEIKQRGCIYCKDRVKEKTCPFDKCPYKELDDIGNYEIETAKIIELFEQEINTRMLTRYTEE